MYWMQRAQRAFDNPALDVAVQAANALKLPCVIFFAPVPFYPHANLRHYAFLQQGIPDIAEMAEERDIGFVLRRFPEHSLIKFCDEVKAALVIGDENPMRELREWREIAAKKLRVPLWTVDADVIVPSKLLGKEQYAARIIRPRLKAHFKELLVPCENPRAHVKWHAARGLQQLDWRGTEDITEGWEIDRSVKPVDSFHGGTREALRLLDEFVKHGLTRYPERHNQADENGTARLSPYLHFGHIGPHTVALAVEKSKVPREAKDDFLDQVITWRELAINMVHFNPLYDTLECGENWAHKTLGEHAKDPRPIQYTPKQLEAAETYDDLWNAAQLQMVHAGWMHNYMRMYWAKKILEWSKSPQVAYNTAVYLNDKYFLDGRDPNGYAGIAWAIVGKFDRPWFPRPIFGTIRYMARSGAEKKFDAEKYIAQMYALAGRERGKDKEAPMLF
ncbi:Deoxyribodipyrimidine photo-lyase type II [Candidatus Koribacter versatilis Ellin345]|uniref:Deoxyribodipyrimidine photo-lyase n=1 Tax=Koribacter versatilis (strain Ellin345) TaxID=204669 RepID=Q1II03_KORVE|nr:Deoxyribodipyrimidine photo-lyase type II [Candidatus Koribacter versatilis Ellin345]